MPESELPNARAIFWLATLLLIGGCKQSHPPKTEMAPVLSVEELLANSQRHSHTMVKVAGCFVVGLESVTLRTCHDKALKDAIWIQNARVVQEMEKLRLPDVPDVTPRGLEKTTRKRVLFGYDETRNDEVWKKLKPPGAEQAVLEAMLLGQFEATESHSSREPQPKHSEFGTYRYQLILADVLSVKPARLSAQTEQTRAAIHTTICEIVEEPLRFVGEKVRFRARFSSDGIERDVLVDDRCSRGIVPYVWDEFEHERGIEALDGALRQGMRSTMDKRIVGIFTGRFALRDSYLGPIFALNIERIERLEVSVIDLRPHLSR